MLCLYACVWIINIKYGGGRGTRGIHKIKNETELNIKK